MMITGKFGDLRLQRCRIFLVCFPGSIDILQLPGVFHFLFCSFHKEPPSRHKFFPFSLQNKYLFSDFLCRKAIKYGILTALLTKFSCCVIPILTYFLFIASALSKKRSAFLRFYSPLKGTSSFCIFMRFTLLSPV